MDQLGALDTKTAATGAADRAGTTQEASAAWNHALDHAVRSNNETPARSSAAGSDGGGKPQTSTSVVVHSGETLSELSARYGVPVRDILAANPAVADPDLIRTGQKLTVPLAKVDGVLPGRYIIRSGDTLDGIAQRYHTAVPPLAAANNISDPDRIRAGQQIWVPGAGGQVGSGTVVPGNEAGGLPPTATPEARAVNGALAAVQSAQQALAASESSPSNGSSTTRMQLQQELGDAENRLNRAVGAEITSTTGANDDDAAEAKAGQEITARYANDPTAEKLVADAVGQVRTSRQVARIVAPASSESDPIKALQTLNAGYAKAAPAVQKGVRADPAARSIIDAAAAWANEPLGPSAGNGAFPEAQTVQAITRLDHATQGLDKGLAGAVVDRAVSGYETFYRDPEHGGTPLFGTTGMTTLVNLSGRIAGTGAGNDAIRRLAATGAWNGDAVRNAIGAGADPAYAMELARQIKASGQSPDIVVQTIDSGIAVRDLPKLADGESPAGTLDVARRMQAAGLDASGVVRVAQDGAQQFQNKVDGDVAKFANHDAALAWLVKNDGAGMTPRQLNQAVASYRAGQGAAWVRQEAALRQRIADDGTRLIAQMTALNRMPPPQLSGVAAAVDKTLRTIANDPSAGLAISTAISTNPALANPSHVDDTADVFTLSKVGDIGRKFTNELAAAYVRRNVLSKLQGVDLNDPASVAQAKQAIQGLDSESFAKLIGVTRSDTKKAVAALEQAVNTSGSTPEESNAALAQLNKTLSNNASLAKAFNKSTLPGQLLRGVAVAFAGISLYNSYNKFDTNPSDPQNGVKLIVDAAGFAQKNTELLVGLGKIDKGSALGQFGGEWKLAG
ncbi:MAG: LysM peptidoglycan-binding domain-containing protein, partial [Alphaproteobacteria bacterium]|nr:LysM peptidoglycan-binding domain-containing protein [Alphaproteobacteria bacterium]